MAGAINYRVIPVDLAIIRSAPGEPIIPEGVTYGGVTVLQLPVGAIASIRFGDNKDPIPLLSQGQSFSFQDACGNPYSVSEKLYVENPAGAGTLLLLVPINQTAGPGGISVI